MLRDANSFDQAFGAAAVLDQIGNGANFQSMLGSKQLQVGQARHGAIVFHDLANHRAGRAACHGGQITARLGMASTHQHAAVYRLQRKDVAGLHQVVSAWLALATATCTVRARSAALMPVVTPSSASIDTVNAVLCLVPLRVAMGGSFKNSQRSLVEREADQARGQSGP